MSNDSIDDFWTSIGVKQKALGLAVTVKTDRLKEYEKEYMDHDKDYWNKLSNKLDEGVEDEKE